MDLRFLKKRAWAIVFILWAIAIIFPGSVNADVQYDIIYLPKLGSGSGAAFGINELGDIVGSSDGPIRNKLYPILWKKDPNTPDTYILHDLREGYPEETNGAAQAINFYGQVAGNLDGTAFVYTGSMTILEGYYIATGGYCSNAKAINDNGQIVLNGNDGHGYIYDLRVGLGSITHDLGDLEGGLTTAINSSGQVIGSKNGQAFFWDPDQGMTILPTLGGDVCEAFALNDNGVVVGRSTNPDGVLEIFLWDYESGITGFPLPEWASYFKPNAINNNGQVVGMAYGSSGGYTGALWENGILTDLSDLRPFGAEWKVYCAYGISQNGWIVGRTLHGKPILLKPNYNPPPPPSPFEGIKNPSFEEHDENYWPDDWHLGSGQVNPASEPIQAYDGSLQVGNLGDTENPVTGIIYQVLDLYGITNWQVFLSNGDEIEYKFIKYSMDAFVANIGGTSVSVGLEILPYSYNRTNKITWNDPAWQARDWQVQDNGQGVLEFVNHGGDAINLGLLIKDETVSYDPVWQNVTHEGWLPRVRWVRLRIEFDATNAGGYPLSCVAVDQVSFEAESKQYGPYSNFGHLPEAGWPEDPNAPDKPVPGWVGEEGAGISGGYTGITKRNYVNPAFAGFADDYVNYLPSGQEMGNWLDAGKNITGRPFTDAGWVDMIVVMGEMDEVMLADYFSDNPSGEFHPGEITAVFNESPITNGPGHDFAGFENGFALGWTTVEIFGELVYTEVSSNGTDFIRMPTNGLTPYWPGSYGCFVSQGVFGLIGKHVNAYGDSWGTPFDLDWIADHPKVLDGTVDLSDIRYVRLVDIPGGGPLDAKERKTALFYDSYGLPIFDSWPTWGSGGADLDAVAVLNSSAPDTDGDHITDYWDNCSETENQKQYDTDQDGYGNMCDCDLDNDNNVNAADFNILKEAWMSNGPIRIPGEPGQPDEYTDPSENWNADADFDGDNYVNITDFNIMKERWNSSAPFK